MVSKIRFKNFKLFKDWQTLEIKPITILIGKNNTGKTAVLKLPILVHYLLNKGLISALNKIKIGSESNFIELGTDFNDLVYNRSDLGILELEISNNQQTLMTVISKDGILALKRNEISIEIDNINIINCNEDILNQLKYSVDYIGGIRVEPEYNYLFDSNVPNKIGVKGQNTYPILIQDFKRREQLLNRISEWYKNNFEGWEVGVIENRLSTETNYSVVISANNIDAINIKQAGQGIHQALPLITRSFMGDTSPTIIAIEEPEAHLHPAAHGNLAQRFVESYLEDNNKRYLIETHSENFILRLQNLIADPDIPFNIEDIMIYYVDYDENEHISKLQPLKIEEDGEIENWPDNVFNENVDEVFKLRRNQKKRQQYASEN